MVFFAYMVLKVSTEKSTLYENIILKTIDSGKTTVLATVVERLDQEKTNDTILLYMNCGPHGRGAAAKSLTVDTVYNTLLYLLYNYARRDENDLKLLEDCNNVFAIQKEKEKARSMAAIINDDSTDSLPEFVYAFLAIVRSKVS